MLLHLHQCQLDFLVNFFGEKSSSGNQSSSGHPLDSDGSKTISTTKSPAGLTFAEEALLPYFQASYGKILLVMHIAARNSLSHTDSCIVVSFFCFTLINLYLYMGLSYH